MTPFLLVIPCYRESARIGPFLDQLLHEVSGDSSARILVVDDGSGPEEAERMREIVDSRRGNAPSLSPVLHLAENAGKGGAILHGWDSARPEETLLAFTDADGATSASETLRLIHLARERPQCAIFASRIKMLGKNVERLASRHYTGRIFATMVSRALKIPVYDSQCGMKVLPAESYRQIRPRLVTTNFAFDVDLLAQLWYSGFEVREEPVDWKEIPGGKVRMFRDSLRMFREVRIIARRIQQQRGGRPLGER